MMTNFSQNGRPKALSGLREYRPQYILKTRITKLQTGFRLRQVFAKKVETNFSTEILFVSQR